MNIFVSTHILYVFIPSLPLEHPVQYFEIEFDSRRDPTLAQWLVFLQQVGENRAH